MTTELNEPIQVEVLFAEGKTQPVWFAWRGRNIQVKETTFTWKHMEGSTIYTHFSVTDGTDTYELVVDSKHFSWKLAKVEAAWRESSFT